MIALENYLAPLMTDVRIVITDKTGTVYNLKRQEENNENSNITTN